MKTKQIFLILPGGLIEVAIKKPNMFLRLFLFIIGARTKVRELDTDKPAECYSLLIKENRPCL